MTRTKITLKNLTNLNIFMFTAEILTLAVLCFAKDNLNFTEIGYLIDTKVLRDKTAYSVSSLRVDKQNLRDVNNGSAFNTIGNNGYFMPLYTNGSGDAVRNVSAERIPIREIVLQPDGEIKGGESPRISGAQLVDITKKAEDRMLNAVPLKNGSVQRDRKGKTKVRIENKRNKEESIILDNSAEFIKVTIPTKMGVETEDKFSTMSGKRTANVSADKAYFFRPMPLVSDDCNEMKTNSLKNVTNQREKDMEFAEKEKIPTKNFTKNTADARGIFLSNSKSVSHVHSYDKSRRAVEDYKVKLYTSKRKSEININKDDSENKHSEYEMRNIPFETDDNFVIEPNTTLHTHSDSIKVNEYIDFSNVTKIKQHLPTNISFDYLKKKTLNINKGSFEEDSQINNTNTESSFKTLESTDIDGTNENKMTAPRPNKKNIHELWSARHERERDRDTVIRFSTGLARVKYVTPTLKLIEGTFLFRFLSSFFTFLHPFDFPTELLRDVMWNTISVPQLILQSIRVEVGFIIAIIIALVMALVVPAYGLCAALLRIVGGISRKNTDANSPPPGMMNEAGGPCEKRIYLLLMQIIILLSLLGVTTMVLGNELACSGASVVKDFLSATMRDIPTYTQGAHHSMSHVLLHGADQTISALEHDLNRVDVLLGKPIQAALSAETGVDVALDALTDIASVSNGLSEKVLALGACGSRAAALTEAARERLRDLKRQADMAKRHCGLRDRPLCDTSDTTGVELVMHFDMVTEENLESLATILNAKNLTEATDNAKLQFNDIPMAIANETNEIIGEVKDALYSQRLRLQVSERSLTKAALHISTETTRAGRYVENILRSIDAVEFWRWLLFLLTILFICLVILLQIVAVSCGCCGVEDYAAALSKTSLVITCLLSIPLWLLCIVVFVAGGHGEVFVCRPLYDDPHYTVLGKLLDRPGLLYNNNSGFFHQVFEELSNISMSVPMSDVLRGCKHNRPAYPVFRIRELLDMNEATAHYNWSALQGVREKLAQLAPIPATQLSAPNAYEELKTVMRAASSVNFTEYRLQMNGPLIGKDLSALADQFESIANQITDLTTSSRIETLASRTRRLHVNTIQPLEQLRTELVFRLTELELQLQPFHKQINQSLSHLRTIQYYIDNQGGVIAEKKVLGYVSRLTGYLEQYRGHVLDQMENHVAPCGPLWDIYDAGRSLVCRHYIDSLNGFWLGLTCCLLLWIIAAPLSLRLRRACRASRDRKEGLLLRTISHQSSSENAAISDQSAWATPGEHGSNSW